MYIFCNICLTNFEFFYALNQAISSIHLSIFQLGLALQSRILVLGSKEAEEEEAEKNLEIDFRLLIDTKGWSGVVWKVVQGVTQMGVAHWG